MNLVIGLQRPLLFSGSTANTIRLTSASHITSLFSYFFRSLVIYLMPLLNYAIYRKRSLLHAPPTSQNEMQGYGSNTGLSPWSIPVFGYGTVAWLLTKDNRVIPSIRPCCN